MLPFGPSASLHPSHCATLVGPARLRPRVARVLRTTPLRPATSIHHPRCATLVCPARLRPLVARVLRTKQLATGTSDQSPSRLGNVAPSFFMVNVVFASGIVLRTFRSADSIAWYGRKGCCPSDLPLRSIPPTALRLWAPPAYGRGWPGSSGQHPLAALALQINPPRGPNRAQRSPSSFAARPTCKTEGRPNAL